MKNLRKAFALVLVIAMAFSLVTIASAAKLADYSDAASVTQKEAVDVLSQAGVLAGANGAFSPTDNFTREQAAKVIVYLMLGSKVADSLKTTTSSFSDVAATRWSAPFIQYGVTAGVINGMGDGTFNPEGKVTGTQFAKMLLTALGYGKNGEYVGPVWELNTLKDAVALEVLDLDVDFTAPATREQVAQYALNALILSAVVWDKDTDEYVLKNLNNANYFATKLGLVRTATTVGGVTGYKWALNGNDIGFYADEKLVASDATGLGISMMTDKYGMWAMFFKAELETGAKFYYNGTEISAFASGNTYAVDNLFVLGNTVFKVTEAGTGTDILASWASATDADLSQAAEYAVPGAVVSFMNTDKDTKAETVSIIEKKVVQVTGAPSVSFGSVKVPGLSFNGATTVNEAKINYPAGIEADDYILYYQDAQTGVWHLEEAQTVTGVATKSSLKNGATFYNISGTDRRDSALTGAIGAAALANFMNGGGYNVDLTIIVDNGGNIIDIDAATNAAAASNYAVVLEAAPISTTFSTGAEAMLLFTDGSTKLVTLGKVDNVAAKSEDTNVANQYGGSYNADLLEGKFVTYTIGTDGKYNLKTTTANYPVAGSVDINRAATFIDNDDFTGDSETIFLYRENRNTSYGDSDYYDYIMVKGIANAPDTTGATASGVQVVKYTSSGTAKFVYVPNYSANLATPVLQNVAYIIYDGIFVNYAIYPAKDGEPMYYEYTAIVDGQKTTIKSLDRFENAGGAPISGLFKVVYDDDGYVTAASASPAVAATGSTVAIGTAKASNGVIKIGNADDGYTGFTYNASTDVYYIDTFGGVTVKTVADINRDTDDVVTAYKTQDANDGDLLEAIYITQK